MEQSKQAFLERMREIKTAFDESEKIEFGHPSKMNELYLEAKKKAAEQDINADTLLNNPKEYLELSKVEKMSKELEHARSTNHEIRQRGGVNYLCRTDEKLKELGMLLHKDLVKQAKVDKKKHDDLEARFEKLADEILSLHGEYRQYLDEAEEKKRLFAEIHKNCDVAYEHGLINDCYNFRQAYMYHHLEKIKRMRGV